MLECAQCDSPSVSSHTRDRTGNKKAEGPPAIPAKGKGFWCSLTTNFYRTPPRKRIPGLGAHSEPNLQIQQNKCLSAFGLLFRKPNILLPSPPPKMGQPMGGFTRISERRATPRASACRTNISRACGEKLLEGAVIGSKALS